MSPLSVLTVAYRSGVSPDPAFAAAAWRLAAAGYTVDGLLQDGARGSAERCAAMSFVDIAGGRRVAALEERGAQARGCRIDLDGLSRAAGWLAAAIAGRPDVLFVNRFGRQEAEGGGLRGEIASAVLEGVPLVIAVNLERMAQWTGFLGVEVRPIPPDPDGIVGWCARFAPGRRDAA